jgi:uncharacterized alpha-E superfamily protein
MLSRVAENMLWMGRYVERAENTARILDVNFRLLLDIGTAGDHREAWEPLVGLVPQTRDLFAGLYAELTPGTVSRFMTFEQDNPNSIVNSVAYARENARSIRESISSEMWEQLNALYLSVTSPSAQTAWSAHPHAFYRQVQYGSQQFQGTTDATMLHDEGWHFIQAGKFLERADNVTRLLDSKYRLLAGDGAPSDDPLQWIAVLRSVSAYEAFRRQQHAAQIRPREIVEFLLLDYQFPRSVLFCVNAAGAAVGAIGASRHGGQVSGVERALGLLHAQLQFADLDEIVATLHAYLDVLQRHFNKVNDELQRVYFYSRARPLFSTAVARAAQAMAEQQQQRRVC